MSNSSQPMYKRHVLAVDSRNRENRDITTQAQYKVTFPSLYNVHMIRLISTEVPNTEYVVNKRNNLLFLFDTPTNTEHEVVLTPGTYTATELSNEINAKFNGALGAQFGAIFQATAMTMTSKVRIDRVDQQPWELRFAGKLNTAALVLGFDPAADAVMRTDSFSGNVFTQSTTVMNLAGENFIFMCIRGLSTLSTTERTNDVFAKLIYNVPPRSIAFDSFISNAFVFQQPVNMNHLDVSFLRHDGSLVDFNNIDHSFSLEFYTSG